MGIWRSGRLNLAKLNSLLPIEAKEAVSAIACTETPKSAALWGLGSIIISGLTKLVLEVTSTSPGISRTCFSNLLAVSTSISGLLLRRIKETSLPPPPAPDSGN